MVTVVTEVSVVNLVAVVPLAEVTSAEHHPVEVDSVVDHPEDSADGHPVVDLPEGLADGLPVVVAVAP